MKSGAVFGLLSWTPFRSAFQGVDRGGVVSCRPNTDSVSVALSPRNTIGVMGDETKRLLAVLSPPFRTIAAAVGVSYDTVKGWSAGRTDPSPENRQALAAFARRQAEELTRLADELEG